MSGGIAGAIGTPDPTLIKRMMASLRHRGPDGIGYYQQNRVHLGAARLSIIDPASGPQPLSNETGQICIVLNGEVYNHRELRADLKRKGHIFTTETDTEVVLHLYEELGQDCVRHLRGMFAFAILDGQHLLLARDRYGIKPLYYTFLPEAQLFLFASEIKALLQCPEYTPRLDIQAWANSIVLERTVGTGTSFAGVKVLAAGHTMSISWHQQISLSEPKPYFTRQFTRNLNLRLPEALDKLEVVLRDSVEAHLAADTEVGLTLSGGLDSTLLALLSQEYQSHSFTFCIAASAQDPDLLLAQRVAAMIGSSHQSIIMSFADYLAAIPGCTVADEKPCVLLGLPIYFLCSQIAQRVKACLVGVGADTLCCEYLEEPERVSKLARIRKRLPLLQQLNVTPSNYVYDEIEHLSSSMPFDAYLQRTVELSLGEQRIQHHLNIYDKYGMAAGLEMRTPYFDHDVVELFWRLPLQYLVRRDLGIDKYILRHLCLRRFGHAATDIVLRRKRGFPSAARRLLWRFDRLCNETLPDNYLTHHELGFCFQTKRDLLMFELFHEIFIVHRGDPQAVGPILDFMRSL